jgi:hypothetical protein
MALLKSPCEHTRCRGSRTPCPPPPGRPPPFQSPGPARGTRWPCWSPQATDTRCRGSRTPRPPPPGRPPPLQSPGPVLGTQWPAHSPPATDTRCRGSRTPRPLPPGRPHPWQLSGAPCGARAPWKSSPDSDTLFRGCNRPTQPCSARKSARRQPPPWPRAPAPPRPASRQHRQAALVSPTRESGQPSASLPCGCQYRPCNRPCAWPSTP